ncbi:hypothetical protein HRR86_001491 [Exophiala dermatitidis]|uniref:Major facilitator superfamily (MFS) profile domain-containing protein n=1 Tax=Exophiala dermatitidis (strain ATCC 34100 / CBS 525.76 / NIH/UT8656) TaxID=858893 RepID=H6BZ72_EXODN|nr:uncharacterized protein HMPREF1120_04999 [Exophiala dermatitidis NIH/UT8656]EHY56935.1 hypothetical protein HMPREF1120_04999 [Exophiala dermatitidis NIH/UT8656]KAJ4537191.1 hypothetical protein HRR76_005204 [Exophiala dermatitidis]KAJ4634024.1 hypothetical protein HRR86_001491 [Exophiala dermatitidis]
MAGQTSEGTDGKALGVTLTMLAGVFHRLYTEIGLQAWLAAPRDTKILCLQRYFRFFAYGGSTLILVLYLSSLDISKQKIGLFMTLTLLGDVLISLVLTVVADRVGRRPMLAVGAFLMAVSGIVFALSDNFWVLLLASVVGVISPRYSTIAALTSPRSCPLIASSGNEIGPFKAIEESIISHLTPSVERSAILAWYFIAGSTGAACGNIVFGWVVELLQVKHSWSPLESYRLVFWAYALFGLLKCSLVFMLSNRCELEEKVVSPPRGPSQTSVDEASPLLRDGEESTAKHDGSNSAATRFKFSARNLLPNISRETRGILLKLCLLFAMDSVASGLAPVSWMNYFFNLKFNLPEGQLGSLFFVASILSSLSNLAAPALARRIGLIKTMVFTHVPASLALAAIPLPSNSALAMTLLLFRASTNSMDQAPRQAFLAAAVLPSERTAVMGVVNVVKTLSQSVGPVITGILVNRHLFGLAFVLAGSLKILYDIFMLVMFLGYRTVEERAADSTSTQNESDPGVEANGAQVA